MSVTFDLVIRDVDVVDGSGAPRFRADVAVDGAHIARIGDLAGVSGREEVRAAGFCLAPGFIDTHTHDDRVLLSHGEMMPKVSQGVTTVIGGNCGISLAPMPRPQSVPVPPLDLLDAEGTWYRYKRFTEYFSALRSQPAATNCAMLVGHTTLRVIEMDDVNRPASAAEISRMQSHVEEAMEAGAIGASTGLAYAPAACATTEEVIEVCRPLTLHQGLYCTHMRDEGDTVMESLEESFLIGRALQVPVLISHHKVVGQANFGRSEETLQLIAEQMQKQPVCLDCYPYEASSTILTLKLLNASKRTVVTWSRSLPEFAGRDLDDVASVLGCSREEAVTRLQPAGAVYFRMEDRDVNRILKFEETMIGSDGLPHDEVPHPRLWGTFPRVLGHYSRDMGLFPLEKAVHKMTGLSATRFGLAGRGFLREGYAADMVLFNPLTVADQATFEHPMRPAMGINTVWTNGAPVWRNSSTTGKRPGHLLRRTA
ncbi:N-acyl-D-amino-acid deacylase family protein [Comamonas sp. B21-038]|uniref:N-acyl-D-amino-acid deacylase family protein n=1 Tax=Comamonas sp. B21-038 TaxID=2918299 RepID=UPI001EFA5F30|nr:D-aminoacylase [Comamonas sp. B21-038]ULR89753.1 D-aminoacylase [Comamonas sp. B21-038]